MANKVYIEQFVTVASTAVFLSENISEFHMPGKEQCDNGCHSYNCSMFVICHWLCLPHGSLTTKPEAWNNHILGMSSSGQLKKTRIRLKNATGILLMFSKYPEVEIPSKQSFQTYFSFSC